MSKQLLNHALVERRVNRLGNSQSENGVSFRIDGATLQNTEYLSGRGTKDWAAPVAGCRQQVELESR